jgi:hypothetical protein
MKRQLPPLPVLVLIAALVSLPAVAQQSQPAAESNAPTQSAANKPPVPLVPLDIQVVVSRYQGDKKVSSLPYSLGVNANEPGNSRLRMGANVPVPSMAAPKGNPTGMSGPMPGPVTYKDIGTNIDCNARTLDEGRFQVMISVEDTSVYTNVQDGSTPSVEDMPIFRSFRSFNTLVLKDGQTRQFTAATDRVNGEVVKIDVTLRVVK